MDTKEHRLRDFLNKTEEQTLDLEPKLKSTSNINYPSASFLSSQTPTPSPGSPLDTRLPLLTSFSHKVHREHETQSPQAAHVHAESKEGGGAEPPRMDRGAPFTGSGVIGQLQAFCCHTLTPTQRTHVSRTAADLLNDEALLCPRSGDPTRFKEELKKTNGYSQPYLQGPCLTAKGCHSYP